MGSDVTTKLKHNLNNIFNYFYFYLINKQIVETPKV